MHCSQSESKPAIYGPGSLKLLDLATPDKSITSPNSTPPSGCSKTRLMSLSPDAGYYSSISDTEDFGSPAGVRRPMSHLQCNTLPQILPATHLCPVNTNSTASVTAKLTAHQQPKSAQLVASTFRVTLQDQPSPHHTDTTLVAPAAHAFPLSVVPAHQRTHIFGGPSPPAPSQQSTLQLVAPSSQPSCSRFILEDWYQQNITSPYASDQEADLLVVHSWLTRPQVLKWLSNRRNRDSNTKGTVGRRRKSEYSRYRPYVVKGGQAF